MLISKIQNDAFLYITRKEEYIATSYASDGHNHLLANILNFMFISQIASLNFHQKLM